MAIDLWKKELWKSHVIAPLKGNQCSICLRGGSTGTRMINTPLSACLIQSHLWEEILLLPQINSTIAYAPKECRGVRVFSLGYDGYTRIYVGMSYQSSLIYDTIKCVTKRLYNYSNYQCGLLLDFNVYSLWINIYPRDWARYSARESKPHIQLVLPNSLGKMSPLPLDRYGCGHPGLLYFSYNNYCRWGINWTPKGEQFMLRRFFFSACTLP